MFQYNRDSTDSRTYRIQKHIQILSTQLHRTLTPTDVRTDTCTRTRRTQTHVDMTQMQALQNPHWHRYMYTEAHKVHALRRRPALGHVLWVFLIAVCASGGLLFSCRLGGCT